MVTKRFSIVFAVLFLIGLTTSAPGATVDPLLRFAQREMDGLKGDSTPLFDGLLSWERDMDKGEIRIGAILHLENGLPDLSAVESLVVGSVTGNIATAYLPLSELDHLAAVPEIKHIEASRMYYISNDIGLPDANVDQVWNGSPAYTGDGVLVGIIDTGIDWEHEDFRNADGSTRIKALWDLHIDGDPPAGYTYGTEYTETEINNALDGAGTVTEKDYGSHGTHVAGTAAGNGRASGGQYSGVAFEADLLIAKAADRGGFSDNHTIDSMNYLVNKAQALGQPIVINMSLGGRRIPHKKTTGQEQVVDDLSGAGVVFCISAGNDREGHLHHSASANNGTINFYIHTYNPIGGNYDKALVGIWVDGNTSPTVTVAGLEAPPGELVTASGSIGTIQIDNAQNGVDPNNGDKEITIYIGDGEGVDPSVGTYPIVLSGGSGTAHAWRYYSSMQAFFPDSDNSYSLGMPGTAREAITVAAYKTRNSWPSMVGEASYQGSWGDQPVGDIAPFSSLGPTRDEREKPDIAAPGMAIISCYSRYADPPLADHLILNGGQYCAMQGTSMSSPLTSGIVALLLEKNGSLTAAQVKEALRNTAVTDDFTGGIWNNIFGAGKVDAQAAIAAIGGGTGPVPGGDLNDDGETGIVDVIMLVNYIVDPVGHPLTSDAREQADVYPSGGGDGLLNASDLVCIVGFILGTDTPETPPHQPHPAVLDVAIPRLENGTWQLPVTLSGAEIASGQFALSLPGARWLADDIRPEHPGETNITAHAGLDMIKIVLYDLDNELPQTGVTVHIPFVWERDVVEMPVVSGLLVTDDQGHARETEIRGTGHTLAPIGFLQSMPNPTRAGTVISFHIRDQQPARLAIYDLRGRQVRLLSEGTTAMGLHAVNWDGRDDSGHQLSAGVYLYRLSTPEQTMTKKVTVCR